MTGADPRETTGPSGFEWQQRKDGSVDITHDGRAAATLRAKPAADFLRRMDKSNPITQQQIMARVTGNYRRGNERQASAHPRNGR